MKIRRFIVALLTICMVFAFAACSEGEPKQNAPEAEKENIEATADTKEDKAVIEKDDEKNNSGKLETDPVKTEPETVHPKATVVMENGGQFVIELYPEYAPETVANFIALAEDGFYNGLGFHRIVEGFMAQGGDPDGTGMGGSGKTIPGEFAKNGFKQNTLKHTRGVVSMARSNAPDSASSQFFICFDDASFLDGNYAAFGEVIEGMDVVDSFLEVERTVNAMGEEASPVTPIVMKSVTIER